MAKKLKIAFLARYIGKVNRGAETYVLELEKRLKKNHQITILAGSDSDSLLNMIQGGYDLIIPTNGRLQALKASLGRISGYKTLISGQAGIGKDDIWNIVVTCPNVYVALTDYEMEWAKKWAWRTEVVKIPNGVDLERFKPTGEKINLKLPRPIFLSVGALTWYKHHELTIKAIARLNQGSLLILGSGPQQEKLQKMGEEFLGMHRFKILSARFEEMPKFYRSSDVFTLPSWDREAFGIVYVEAMASNLPVVAPDDLPRREIIGKAGILTDVNDPDKFAHSLIQAWEKKWDNIPRQQAERFSWDKVAAAYEQVLGEMFK